jgi:hypothetical protein
MCLDCGSPDDDWSGCTECGLPDAGAADCHASCRRNPDAANPERDFSNWQPPPIALAAGTSPGVPSGMWNVTDRSVEHSWWTHEVPNGLFGAVLIYKNDDFTKTGSGQT